MLIEVNDDELTMIYRRREEIGLRALIDSRCVKSLITASEYEQWLNLHGRGSSFSTFINEFNYQGESGELLFKAVEAARKAVREVLSR